MLLSPFISNLPSLLKPLPPIHPCIINSARSLGTAPPLTAVRAVGVLGQETGGKSLQEEAGIYTWRLICRRSEEPPTPPSFLTLRGVGSREWMLVCPPAVAVVRRLVDLRLLLDGGVLAALSSAALSVLLQVVVQNLRVGLLVWCQDMHEWSWSVAGSGRRVDGTPAAQRRGQAE